MSSTFVESPAFDNWFRLYKPAKSLLICSPYIKKYALDKIISKYRLDSSHSKVEVEVLLRGKLEDFIKGSSDISVLEALSKPTNLKVKTANRLTNLHMKAYMIDEKRLLIGSGNFTRSGLFSVNGSGNVEGAIETTDMNIIDSFKKYYTNIRMFSEPLKDFYSGIIGEYTNYIGEKSDNYNIREMIASSIEKQENQSKYIFSASNTDVERNTSIQITPEIIPQFSSFEHGTFTIVKVLVESGDKGFNFLELGEILEGGDKSDLAYRKYGENHAKLAELLDLVTITNTRPREVFLTRLGKKFYKSSEQMRINILKSQIMRMDIVKYIIENSNKTSFDLMTLLLEPLERSTALRRISNIRTLFRYLIDHGISDAQILLEKL